MRTEMVVRELIGSRKLLAPMDWRNAGVLEAVAASMVSRANAPIEQTKRKTPLRKDSPLPA